MVVRCPGQALATAPRRGSLLAAVARPKTTAPLSVMMPVYNEAGTLETIVSHVLARPEVGELIAVDDGSTDSSWQVLQQLGQRDRRLRLFRQGTNQGKGAALRRAISELRLPFAVVQDADLEYDPADYGRLLEPLAAGRADVVYGVRGFAGQTAYSFWFVVGNGAVTLACNLLFNSYISDLETGYKMLRSELWQRLNLSGSRFDIEPDVTARVLRLGYRIHEVPIHYYARSRQEGKKLTWRDGVVALGTLLRLRLRGRRALFGEQDEYHRRRQQQLALYHPLRDSRSSLPPGTS